MRTAYTKSIVKSIGLSALMLTAACGGEQPVDESISEALDTDFQPGSRIHIMPVRHPGEARVTSTTATAHLTNYGGPVLSSVHVIPVYWNSKVTNQTTLNAFYGAVVKSPYYDMLSQYSSIGRGDAGTPYVDSKTGTKLSDSQIQTELSSLIKAGKLPKPTANTYYPVHFPAGVSITDSSGSAHSCVEFCAYHGTFAYGGVNVNYGVIPDQGGACAGGCGSDPSLVNNLTSVSSHELVEATTDPAVGLAVTLDKPLAWYDSTNGEIGDICNAEQGKTVGGDGKTYVVQKEFSNKSSTCVDH
jgi:hypothetical protein